MFSRVLNLPIILKSRKLVLANISKKKICRGSSRKNIIMLIYFVSISRDFEFCQIMSLPPNLKLFSLSFSFLNFVIMLMYFCCVAQMSSYMAVVFRQCRLNEPRQILVKELKIRVLLLFTRESSSDFSHNIRTAKTLSTHCQRKTNSHNYQAQKGSRKPNSLPGGPDMQAKCNPGVGGASR